MFLDARVSSAKQRPELRGLAAQGVPSRPTRQRKVSRSAGPSLAALRKALKISGGECISRTVIISTENIRRMPLKVNMVGRSRPGHFSHVCLQV